MKPMKPMKQGRARLTIFKSILIPISLIFVAVSSLAGVSVFPTGVTRYDPEKAYNSYVLFAAQDQKTHLIDMNGNEVKIWNYYAFPPVFIDPKLINGKRGHVLLQLDSDTTNRNSSKQSLGEVDWNDQVVWRYNGAQTQDAYGNKPDNADTATTTNKLRQHHDWHRLPNGNTLLLVNYVRPVTGFKAESLLEDGIVEVNPHGDIVWRWDALEHLPEFGFSEASLQLIHNGLNRNDKSQAFDYLHLNNMSVVGKNHWYEAGDQRFHPDNIVIDSREANFISIIEKKTGKIVWCIGPDFDRSSIGNNKVPRPVDQIVGQHDAHIIPDGLPGAGNLLVFDNQGEAGYPRVPVGMQPRSRVLEINPVNKEIVWQYTGVDSGRFAFSFYSSYISSARRLPNGNTLIDEGMNGRLFQVTKQGEIVWEYVSPYFSQQQNSSNTVYRAQPVPYDWAPNGTPRAEIKVTPPDLHRFKITATNKE